MPSYSRTSTTLSDCTVVPVGVGHVGVVRADGVETRRQGVFAYVAERGVTQVVAERDRLGQVLVQPQRPRARPRDLRDLERVREPRAVVIALGRQEDLRLVGQSAKGLAVDDPVSVALVLGSVRVGRQRDFAAPRAVGECARGSESRSCSSASYRSRVIRSVTDRIPHRSSRPGTRPRSGTRFLRVRHHDDADERAHDRSADPRATPAQAASQPHRERRRRGASPRSPSQGRHTHVRTASTECQVRP